MNAEPKLSRLILSSPWPLLIFLVVPILVILNLALHLGLHVADPRLLLVNNICFALLVSCRLVWYLSRLKQGVRYGALARVPLTGFDLQLPAARAREPA